MIFIDQEREFWWFGFCLSWCSPSYMWHFRNFHLPISTNSFRLRVNPWWTRELIFVLLNKERYDKAFGQLLSKSKVPAIGTNTDIRQKQSWPLIPLGGVGFMNVRSPVLSRINCIRSVDFCIGYWLQHNLPFLSGLWY